jgi:hypothetical protein
MDMGQEIDHRRLWAYFLVALASLFAGMALGQLNANREAGRPRIDWSAPRPPQPRYLGP